MREKELILQFKVYEGLNELEDRDRALLGQAVAAAAQAYAPYSQFRVGAAVLLDNGKIILGNNQENLAYPSGLCAERVAVYAARANFPDARIQTVAITARAGKHQLHNPVYPCGACRQVLVEVESKQNSPIRVLMAGPENEVVEARQVADLLPLQFSAHLSKE
jgi:cytidine deaminase